jgi:hypothetical protein
MGTLCWKNNSSYTVSWFFITATGSISQPLDPGESYEMPNSSEMLQVGIHVSGSAVYIINNLNTHHDSDLVASDIVPFGGG